MVPLLLAGAVAVATAGVAPVAEPRVDTVRWNGRLDAGRRLSIDNPRGDIRLRGAEGADVELTAAIQRLGPAGRAAAVDVTPDGAGLRVQVRVPDGERGRFEDRVDLVVIVPRAAEVVARAGFGRLEARGLAGSLEASTESGEVAVDLAGRARIRSVSGRIEAQVARAAWAAGVELASGAGAVRVELARDAEGELEIHGRDRVLVDLALPFRREPGEPLRGRVGEGAGRLSIEAGSEIQLLLARPRAAAAGGAR